MGKMTRIVQSSEEKVKIESLYVIFCGADVASTMLWGSEKFERKEEEK